MSYKIISKIISKDELKTNTLIKEEFVLNKEYENNLNLIHGVITNENNEKIKNCAVLLQYRIKSQNEYEDLSISYTNDEGIFGFQIEIDDNKEYRFLVFAPNKIN